ncbi:MAG: 5-dehydro-2-deoxygluconokinase [Blastocatellia bacterium]|nr:5-dehydro-2-deoxygluconokinase [Blastocatellia bacterium]MCS7156342.1 5-dehydro-2-deoxygluconokinase [Blastocatellia bacterium]MCX7751307.1 5-dehydro-2-deoxygluconokinase [Blastocatellia bacterium]MDW8169020.1 5-dehydro-2-deoxygluconokinase [Acidobacteriota bacterium]MDW8256380.1 5-dehydro-2-deoxygluconokinase [Acidobacteriota bacterium]
MTERRYDLLAMGRSSIDLYAADIGAPFPEIKSFAAYVGGCPTNISVGARRLGLRSALLTAVGDDLVGDFVLRFLEREGVETRFIPRKPGRRTSAVLLGVEPPDRFPLVYYRDNCADMELTIDDVLAAPIAESRVLLISGTGLSREPSRSATLFAAERARAHGTEVFLDLDFRPTLWHDVRGYGVTIRLVLPLVDVVLGTVNEVKAAALVEAEDVHIEHAQISESHVAGEVDRAIRMLLERGPRALIVKRGAEGATVHLAQGDVIVAPAFPVEVLNVLGAGDAFAAGFLYGYLKGWNWYRAARMGNACGAIIVTRHGCANFMPYEAEVLSFIETHGGF